MVPNVVGMSQYADGGVLATKPYVGGGNYINKMSDYCGGCVYDPKVRLGPTRLPVHRRLLGASCTATGSASPRNFRMAQMVRGLDRLADLDQLLAEEHPALS